MANTRTPIEPPCAAAKAVLATALAFLVLTTVPARAENWPQWRGPNLTGAAESVSLPALWGPEQNVLWAVDLPGSGSATPVVWENRIFLNAADSETNDLLALCLDAETGAERWRRAHGPNQRVGRNDRTAPSPVTDGDRVIFMFGTGRMIAYDFDGQELWRRELMEDLGAFNWMFGYGASPLLHNGRLYVQMMRRPQPPRGRSEAEPVDSYLVAIDPVDGKDLWRHTRPTDARGESHEAYVTPLPFGQGEDSQIVLVGGDAATSHSAATGEELWRYDYNVERRRANWRVVPTPVTDGEKVFAALPRGSSLVAFRPGGERGTVEERALWTMADDAPDVCSPLLYRGRLYVLDGDRRTLTSLDPASGERYWRGDLGDGTVVRSSPTAADGRIYAMDERGRVFVAGTGDEFELLATIDMGGGQPARSSIPIVNDRLYVRTASRLFCVGNPR